LFSVSFTFHGCSKPKPLEKTEIKKISGEVFLKGAGDSPRVFFETSKKEEIKQITDLLCQGSVVEEGVKLSGLAVFDMKTSDGNTLHVRFAKHNIVNMDGLNQRIDGSKLAPILKKISNK